MRVLFSVWKARLGSCAASVLRLPFRLKAALLRWLKKEPRLRIALVTFGWTPLTGGIGNYLMSLIWSWPRFVPENPLHVYSTKGAFDHLKRLPFACRLESQCLFAQEQIREREKTFDVYLQIGHFEPSPPPRRSVYYLADLQEYFFPEFFSAEEIAKRRRHHGEGARFAQRILTGSRFCAESLEILLNLPAGLSAVLHLPVGDLPAGAVRPSSLPESVRRYVYFPADDYRHKNHQRLFRAVAKVRETGLDVDLVCTGGRISGRNLPELAAESGLEGHFFDLGKVSRENVSWLYTHSRALAFPTLFEGFGLPVLEAFSKGLPVVCSGVSSLTELGGDAVHFTNPFDEEHIAQALLRVLGDRKHAESLAEKGRRRMEAFSIERIIRSHYELLKTVAGEPLRVRSDAPPEIPGVDAEKSWQLYRATAVDSLRELLPERRPEHLA